MVEGGRIDITTKAIIQNHPHPPNHPSQNFQEKHSLRENLDLEWRENKLRQKIIEVPTKGIPNRVRGCQSSARLHREYLLKNVSKIAGKEVVLKSHRRRRNKAKSYRNLKTQINKVRVRCYEG